MTSYGDAFVEAFAESLAALRSLSHSNYSEDNVRQVVSRIGTKTELFLKSIVFPQKDSRGNFASFIDELGTCGVSATHVRYFHDLRHAYNAAKHDPNARVTLVESVATLSNARDAALALVTTNSGAVSLPACASTRRVFWIAAWDHYNSGDTEVHVILPGTSDHWLGPPKLDYINISISEWDNVKSEMADVGVLRDGKGLIPEQQYALFNADSDFLQGLVFEGEYRELLSVLGNHESRQELITGLNRQDSGQAMVLAFMLATIDAASYATPDSIGDAIKSQAVAGYAVPLDYGYADYIANGFANMLSQIRASDWRNITGPVWLSEEQYNKCASDALATHPEYSIIVTRQHTMAEKWTT